MSTECSKTQKGFTLVEVLMAGSILVVISAMMLSFFIQDSNLWQLIVNQSYLRSIGRNAMNYMM